MNKPKLLNKNNIQPWDLGYDNMINSYMDNLNKYINYIEAENIKIRNENKRLNVELAIELSKNELSKCDVDTNQNYPVEITHENINEVFDNSLTNISIVFKVAKSRILSKRQNADIIEAKVFLGAMLTNVIYRFTTTELGDKLNRDHSTVVYYNKSFLKFMSSDAKYIERTKNKVHLLWGDKGINALTAYCRTKKIDI